MNLPRKERDMKEIIIGRHKKSYIVQVMAWARRLGAEEVTIWTDGSVTLECRHGNICREYKPTVKELERRGT